MYLVVEHGEVNKLVKTFSELREKTSLTATSGKGLAELQHGKSL